MSGVAYLLTGAGIMLTGVIVGLVFGATLVWRKQGRPGRPILGTQDKKGMSAEKAIRLQEEDDE